MDPMKALSLIDGALASMSLPRESHQKLVDAVNVIAAALQPPPTKE